MIEIQDAVLVEAGGGSVGDLADARRLALPRAGLGVQARVAQEHADVLPHRLEHGDLGVGQGAARRPPHEVEPARRLVVEHQGDRHRRLVREARDHLERGEARVAADVVRRQDPGVDEQALAEVAVRKRDGRARQEFQVILGHAVGGDRLELGVLRVGDVGGDGVGAGHVRQLAPHQPERLGHVRRAPHHARDLQERRGFAETVLEGALPGSDRPDHHREGIGQRHDLPRPLPRDRPVEAPPRSRRRCSAGGRWASSRAASSAR